MESKNPARFMLGRQSSLAPERHSDESELHQEGDGLEGMDPGFRLMCLAIEGDLDGIRELTNKGVSVNHRDIDNRTPLHVAACQGLTDVVALLLEKGPVVEPQDRWGSTPLADAIHCKNNDAIKLLEKHGAKRLTAPMHVNHAQEVPEYEIDPKELDFTNSVEISKGNELFV